MHGMMKGLIGVVALAVAALAGCGDDDDATPTTVAPSETTTASGGSDATGDTVSAADATEDDYLAAIERSLSSAPEGGMRATPEQAACVAPRWLDTIGVDRLKELDIAPAQIGDDRDDDGSGLEDLGLTEEQGGAMFDAFGECDVDLHAQFVETLTAELDDEAASCVTDAVDEDLLRELMVSVLVEGQPQGDVEADFEAALAPCEDLVAPTTAAG